MPGKKLPEAERREEILEGAYRVATREHLMGLSMRAVAEEAGVSKGLVFFHFRDKETLLLALLDWLLERSPRVELPEDLEPAGGSPGRRLLQVVRHQIAHLPERRGRVELFLDFWVMGKGRLDLHERIRSGFDRYRSEFEPYTTPVVEVLPAPYRKDGARGMAAVIVSFIQGCSLQLMADPEGFDVEQYMHALEALVMGSAA